MNSLHNSLSEKFDITRTNANKGFALLLLLWHHLFYQHPEYGTLTYALAEYAKVCVSIFIILSGYGLAESIKNKKIGLFSFYKKRLIKLYMTYWLIIIVFVPIGIFFIDRTLVSIFGDYAYMKFIVQTLGFHMFTSNVGYGYNATWWFMSLIIGLYILFPLIYFLIQKFGIWIILFTLLIQVAPTVNYIGLLQHWILPFTLGIFLSKINGFIFFLTWLKKLGIVHFVFLIFLMTLSILLKHYGLLLGILIILFITQIINLSTPLRQILNFIGIHSFNIFLFHTFIYFYYWKDIIYFTDTPILIFLSLLFSSLIISISLEYIKQLLYFDKIYRYIINIKIADKIFLQDCNYQKGVCTR